MDTKKEASSEDSQTYELMEMWRSTLAIGNVVKSRIKCLDNKELFENENKLWVHHSEGYLQNVCQLCGKNYVLKAGLNWFFFVKFIWCLMN